MELIKGRWYKNLGRRGDHIGKFSGWYDLECISVSEYIYRGELKGPSECFTRDYKFAEECPLSEIQQYLPEGHPDKEFVLPEKWCVRDCEEVSKWASRVFGCGCFVNSSKYLCVKVEKFPNFDSYCFYSKESASNYTEITFEEFKKYVLKQDDMKEKLIYVKVVDFGKEYSTHSDAREYGMTNYFYWTYGSPRLNSTTKYRVVKNVIVNNSDESYILLDESTGYEYLIQTKGCKIIENMEEREITGYKLKEDCKQYGEAVLKIMNTNWGEPKYHVTVDSLIKDLRKAGILDLWFEPIYKEEFKVGDWVTWSNSTTGRIIGHCKSFADSWSLDVRGDTEQYNSCSESNLRLATPEEIKETLVEEAIKRGFTKGVKIKAYFPDYSPVYSDDRPYEMNDCLPEYEQHLDALRMGGSIIYHKGKWAEILPNYPQIEINGYNGEFFGNYVKFGCAEISKEVFIDLATCREYKNTNRDIESVTIGKGIFTKDQIKQIAEYYLNKK